MEMKKLLLYLTFTASLFAVTGESVFNSKCVSCHNKAGSMMMGQDGSSQRNMKAPPMQMISMRLKHMTDSKKEFVTFVKDYIQNPSRDKGFCMPMAYQRFGVMPPIGKKMSEKEREVVAQWLYDGFTDSWGNMKCGSGKCGGSSGYNSVGKCGSR